MIEVSPFFFEAFDLNDPEEKELSEGLVALFSAYVTNRGHAHTGKDAPYHRPPNTVVTDVNLRHVHIKPLEPSQSELKKWRQAKTSDRCLVYVRSSCKRYLLIAYLHENAHAQAYDFDYIKALAKIAEKWLYRENIFPDLDPVF